MSETFTISNECADAMKKYVQGRNFMDVASIESSINRHIGFIEGIGWALSKDIQPGFYDAIEALSSDIQKLLVIIYGRLQ